MREYRERASSDDLKLFLENSGVTKDMIKRSVTISAKHLYTRDHEGIVKGVKQIPLMYFEPDPRAAGGDKVTKRVWNSLLQPQLSLIFLSQETPPRKHPYPPTRIE